MSSAVAERSGVDSPGWLKRTGRVGLPAALAAYILPRGAPDPLPLFAAAATMGLAAAIAAMVPAGQRAIRRLAGEVLAVAALLSLFVLFQAWSFDGNVFANEVWRTARSFTNTATRAVSVEPSSSYAALFSLLGPFFAYFAVLHLFDSDRAASRLLKILAAAGGLFGLHGLVQMLAFPDGLLLATRFGGTDFTGIFINRNNAGTFLGIACLASLGWLVGSHSSELGSGRRIGSAGDVLARYRQSILAGACLAVCILCLFLTRSRGAILSWGLAFGLVVVLLALNHARLWPRWARVNVLPLGRRWLAVLALLAVVVMFQFMGDRLAARLEHGGVDVNRLCIYAATLRGFQENWLFGTGLGTFPDVFPQYREAGCIPGQGVVLRAHNVFLEALLTMGVAAIAFLLYVYARVGMLLARGYRARNRMRHVPIVGIGGVALVTAHSLSDFSLQIPGVAIYFACFLGAVSVVSLGRQKARVAAEE